MLNNLHYNTKACWKGQEIRRWKETLKRCFESKQVAIKVNMNPLEATTDFPYLGHPITYNNSDWAALYSNLQKDQRRWGMVEKVPGKMGKLIKERTMMYKAVVQAVILYGIEIWVGMDAMMTAIEGFH